MKLKDLSKMAKENLKEKHSNIPEYAIPSFKYTDTTANGLTKCIIDYIELIGGYAFRINA